MLDSPLDEQRRISRKTTTTTPSILLVPRNRFSEIRVQVGRQVTLDRLPPPLGSFSSPSSTRASTSGINTQEGAKNHVPRTTEDDPTVAGERLKLG